MIRVSINKETKSKHKFSGGAHERRHSLKDTKMMNATTLRWEEAQAKGHNTDGLRGCEHHDRSSGDALVLESRSIEG